MKKEYLGDSVYVELDEAGCLVLTTENNGEPSNIIVFEPEVWVMLTDYVKRLKLDVKR